MFNTTNFPDAVGADLNNARALYALLTGRVTAVNGNVRLDGSTGQYVYLGTGRTKEHQDEIGLFVQDAWRIKPTITLNAGLRWQVAMPFQADDSVYSRNTLADLCGISGLGDGPGGRECNMFNPGVFNAGGRTPVYELYTAGEKGYSTEYDNFAPNVGVAWQPNVQDGFMRKILGDPEQATIRASFGMSYNSDGLGFYQGVYNNNPGNHDHDEPDGHGSRSSLWCRQDRRGPCCCVRRSGWARRRTFQRRPCIRWRSISAAA